MSCGLTAPISTLSHTLQDLSFLSLSQNIILQGHSPTLKDEVPRGKEIKLLWLNSVIVQRHLVVLGPTAQALTFSKNQYLIINHNHDLVFTFGEMFSSKGCPCTFLHVSEACDPKCHNDCYTVSCPRANRRERELIVYLFHLSCSPKTKHPLKPLTFH